MSKKQNGSNHNPTKHTIKSAFPFAFLRDNNDLFFSCDEPTFFTENNYFTPKLTKIFSFVYIPIFVLKQT